MTYEVSLGAVGKQADDELAAVRAELATADGQVATLAGELAAATGTITGQAAKITELEAEVKRLTDLYEPVVTLFGAKPEPNTEAEWAANGVRAGAPYKIHNHYAQSWAEVLTQAKACTAPYTRITCNQLNVDPAVIAALPDDKTIILGTLHEPEDNVEDGRTTLAAWKQAQTRTRELVDQANTTRKNRIVFGLCLMGPFTWKTRNPDDYFMPGVHEYIGTDPYAGFVNPKAPLSVTPADLLGRQTAYAAAKGVPVLVCEWGAPSDGGDGRRAALIRAVNQYARDNKFLGVLYWDHGGNSLVTDDEFRAAGGM